MQESNIEEVEEQIRLEESSPDTKDRLYNNLD